MREDVVIVGGGLVGMCAAVAVAKRGMRCVLISDPRPGEASPAAAGMLAPSVEHATGPAHDFGIAARDRYAEFLAGLGGAIDDAVPLDLAGILQVAGTEEEADRLRAEARAHSRWLSSDELRAMEPRLGAASGALHHERDGAVHNERLMDVLRHLVRNMPRVAVVADAAVRIDARPEGAVVHCASGRQHGGSAAIIATGAWTGTLQGLPRTLPIEAVRGQMLELSGAPLRHVVFGGGGYVVPRSGTTLVGSTMERVGFELTVTPAARAHLLGVAAQVCPSLASSKVLRHWAGFRPLTPDLQPIVGRDPEMPSVVYSCGHSRNGILMAPLTGECVAALVCGEEPGYDLTPFSPARFAVV